MNTDIDASMLYSVALKLVKDVLKIKPNENVVITIDSMNDWRVAGATAKLKLSF